MSDGRQTNADEGPATIVKPPAGLGFPDFSELFRYHDLLLFLVVRNIKVRYRQTLLGGAWAVVQPLGTMVMLTFVFGKLIGVTTGTVPYWLFSLAGLVVWIFISQTVTSTAQSLINNSQLVEKVYFPRLAIPLSAILSGVVDFGISFLMLIGILLASGYGISPRLPFVLLAALLAALLLVGIGSALGALSVRYRDINYVTPFLIQLWLFATPIAYPMAIVPEAWRTLIALNPATGIVELFRWATIGGGGAPWTYVLLSSLSIFLLLIVGLLIFKRVEHEFADVI
jgi:lipopolysaccharide transport system permease protein